MEKNEFNQALIAFLNASPTPFHAVAFMAKTLREAGFEELYEGDNWKTDPGKYFVTRNQSSIIAFLIGTSLSLIHI